jgi:hypothetical protein
MRKIAIMVVWLVMAGVGFASSFGSGGGVFGSGGSGMDVGTSNTVYVNPSSNLDTIYANVKAKSPSATNRWQINYLPGVYTRTTTYAIDTSYIDHYGLGNPEDVVITCSTATTATVTQTGNNVKFSNITFKHTLGTTGCYAFLMSASDNSNSVYWKCYFRNSASAPYLSEPMYATTTLGGSWYYCQADNYAYRCAIDISMPATMYYCTAGIRSFFGDNNNNASGTGKLSGYLFGCTAGVESFASCASFGSEISGTLLYCTGGDRSFSIGKPISGTIIRCIGGDDSFAGYSGSGTNYGSVTSTALLQDNIAGCGYCFGMGHASSVQSGRFINNHSRVLPSNRSFAAASTITSAPSAASVTTPFSTVNKNIVLTAKATGTYPTLYLRYFRTGLSITITNLTEAKGTIIKVTVKNAGTSTAAQVKAAIEADGTANALVTVSYPAGGDGSGVIDEIIAGTSGQTDYRLANGGDIPFFSGNQPEYPIICTAATTVYPFDNGATYTNTGATGLVTLTLPAAVSGYSYSFDVAVAQELRVDPSGSETIGLLGVQQGAGKYITNTTAGSRFKVWCNTAGQWESQAVVGTWTVETP